MKTQPIPTLTISSVTRQHPAPRISRGLPGRLALLAAILSSAPVAPAASWQPAAGPLMTRWARDVSPKNAHPEYPRPQMVRKEWLNLNGLWELAITGKDDKPSAFENQILVPFPVESALSGVMKPVSENDRIWYRRTFDVPIKWWGQRVWLHFGAVDLSLIHI